MKAFFDSELGKILRWLLFFPLSILGAFLSHGFVSIIVHTAYTGTFDQTVTLWDDLLREILSQTAGGFFFVYTGCYIVPIYRKFISIFLSIIFILAMGYFIYHGVNRGYYFDNGLFEGWSSIIIITSSIVGAGYASYNIFHDEYVELY